MKIYSETKPLHIEMNASLVGLEAPLLQTRNNTSSSKEEAPDNSILRPSANSTKNTSVQTWTRSIHS